VHRIVRAVNRRSHPTLNYRRQGDGRLGLRSWCLPASRCGHDGIAILHVRAPSRERALEAVKPDPQSEHISGGRAPIGAS